MRKAVSKGTSLCVFSKLVGSTVCSRGISHKELGDFEAARPRRVVITGLGLVTPIGIGVQQAWSRLIDGECGIRAISAGDLPKDQRIAFDGLPSKVAGVVDNSELERACQDLGVPSDSVKSARFIRLGLAAAAEALQDAGWHPESYADKCKTGVAIGSGMSATTELHTAAQNIAAGQPRRLSPFVVPRLLANMAAGMVSMHHGFLGPNHAVSTACTTGAHAIGDAFNFIRHGDADIMVAGGTEACIDAVSIRSFARMRALETRYNDRPEQASRPFDADRGGFVMGEGAGVMLLEELEHAQNRGAKFYAEVRGYGLSADAHHITQPAPDGRGATLAMQRALRNSGVSTDDVAYVNAHATSTPLGDAIEAAAIAKLFHLPTEGAADEILSGSAAAGGSSSGEGKDMGKVPLVSSTKGATGHLLGAAGAVEAIFTVKSLASDLAPPTLNLRHPDPALLGSALVACGARHLSQANVAAMSNSFGFGGTNASLLFTRTASTGLA